MIKIKSKKRALVVFAGVLLLIVGYLKYSVDTFWSFDNVQVSDEDTQLKFENEIRNNNEIRFVSCNGVF